MLLLWSGIYFVILFSLYTPFSILTVSFIMVPGLVMYGLGGRKLFPIYYGLPLLIVWMLLQSMGVIALVVAIFFLAPIVIIGELYHRQAPARTVIFAGTMAFIGQMLLLLIGAYAFGLKPVHDIQQFLWESYRSLPDVFRTGMTDETIDLTIALAAQMIPVFMIITGLFYTSVTHALGGRVLRNAGVKTPVLPPVRKWMLPKSLVWYYLILLVLDLVVKKDLNSMMTMIIINGYSLLSIAFAIQAIAFLFFVGHRRRGGFMFPLFGAVMYLFIPGLVSLLGVLDVAFPIRKGISNR